MAAAFGAFMNQGQICMSTERIIVVDSVADQFVARFRTKVGTMPVGDPRKGQTALRLFRNESFGPVVGITRARDEAHAIELADDTDYGLFAAVVTRDTARGLRIATKIKSGICHVNGPTVHDKAPMPFGSVGASGYGRFCGKAGIAAFTELRWITIERSLNSASTIRREGTAPRARVPTNIRWRRS